MEHEAIAQGEEDGGQRFGRHVDQVAGVDRVLDERAQADAPPLHRLQEPGPRHLVRGQSILW